MAEPSPIPEGYRAMGAGVRRRPLVLVLVFAAAMGLLVGWSQWWKPRPAVSRETRGQEVYEVGGTKAGIAKTLVDLNTTVGTLTTAVAGMQAKHQQMLHEQAAQKQAHEAYKTAMDERLAQALAREKRDQEDRAQAETERKRREADADRRRREAEAKRHAETTKPAASVAALHGQERVSSKPRVGLYFEKSDGKDTFTGAPPPMAENTPYLGVGCLAPIKVVTGVLATLHTTGLPMLLVVDRPFQCPAQLQGPGRAPLKTELPLQGCFITGTAQANLSMERALGQTAILSCVLENGRFFEKPLKASVHGRDGKLGLFGTVQYREGAKLGKALISGLLAGFAQAFQYAKSTTIVTPLGGVVTTPDPSKAAQTAALGGLGQVANRASEFYWQQAQQLLPVVEVESDERGFVVVQDEGIPLEGLAPYLTLASGR